MQVTRTAYPSKLREAARLFAALGCLMVLSSCSDLFASDTIRFRIDLEVPTVHGLVKGSGVLQGEYERGWPSNVFSSNLSGEAILIELPNKAAIVATLHGTRADGQPTSDLVMLPERLFSKRAITVNPDWGGKREAIAATIAAHKGWSKRVSLSEGKEVDSEFPFLIYLSDMRDPRSLRALEDDPVLTGEPRMVVTITSERPSTGIEEKLPWLRRLARSKLPISGRWHGTRTLNVPVPLQSRMSAWSFSTDI